MAELRAEKTTISELFSKRNRTFLIPDYQRPYAWTEEQCQTLWNDLFDFSFPNNNPDSFDDNQEYFLGPIVTFDNEYGKTEVIDGQQRLITILLLFRALYERGLKLGGEDSARNQEDMANCLWKRPNKRAEFDKNSLKIESEVVTDNDKDEFVGILKTGQIEDGYKSRYAKNYSFFQSAVDDFINQYPAYFLTFSDRILDNCILLPIEAISQDTALRIFSTLNDRGLPLSDADIFKAQMYKFYSSIGEKENFIERWKELDELSQRIFPAASSNSMDELFTRYMYFIRAKQGNKATTTEALRKFYEKDSYALFHQRKTLDDLEVLANFWIDIISQNDERFSEQNLKDLFVLKYSPNNMWMNIISTYFLEYKDRNGNLDSEKFSQFLETLTVFVLAYSLTNPGVNALRTPIYAEMINIVERRPVTYDNFRFDRESLMARYKSTEFGNNKPITKAFITWWAFQNSEQQLLPYDEAFQIEHIFPRRRKDELEDPKNVESLGNKALLESRINVRATDYRFEDKKKYYKGEAKPNKPGTKIIELLQLAEKPDFTEYSISKREDKILENLLNELESKGLLT